LDARPQPRNRDTGQGIESPGPVPTQADDESRSSRVSLSPRLVFRVRNALTRGEALPCGNRD
jgi:hypothetical protein